MPRAPRPSPVVGRPSTPPRRRSSRVALPILLATVALPLASCGDDAADASGAAPAATGATTVVPGGATTYPVTLDNCGHAVTVDRAPRRVVSVNQGSTEILLSLGLQDRIKGTATWTDKIRPNLAAANAKVPRLSDGPVSTERVLQEEPDLVTASFGGALEDGDPDQRDRYDKLGVATYVAPSHCENRTDSSGDGPRSEPLHMRTIYAEIRELARIFDVQDRGEALVRSLEQRMERATGSVDGEGVSVAYWFANTESPYMAGCCGSPGIMTRALGVENAFADTHTEWPQVSWETVLDRDPTILVLGDLQRKSQTGDKLADKIRFLESNPVTRRLTAVRHKRYVIMNGADMNPSIRTVDGVEKLAAGIRELRADD
ncbi:MAG: ABC transporter substrate-binding protein [Solirubrobacteraceae bacterium]|nr:ABC transporter substrate-binding protein [Solirubrobacteraceae bacterium]